MWLCGCGYVAMWLCGTLTPQHSDSHPCIRPSKLNIARSPRSLKNRDSPVFEKTRTPRSLKIRELGFGEGANEQAILCNYLENITNNEGVKVRRFATFNKDKGGIIQNTLNKDRGAIYNCSLFFPYSLPYLLPYVCPILRQEPWATNPW